MPLYNTKRHYILGYCTTPGIVPRYIMKLISERQGKQKGETGVTVHIYKQRTKPMETATITIHGLSVQQIAEKIKFFFKHLTEGKVRIEIER